MLFISLHSIHWWGAHVHMWIHAIIFGRKIIVTGKLIGGVVGGFRRGWSWEECDRWLFSVDCSSVVVNWPSGTSGVWGGRTVPHGPTAMRWFPRFWVSHLAFPSFVICPTRTTEISTAATKTEHNHSKTAKRTGFVVAFGIGRVCHTFLRQILHGVEFGITFIFSRGPCATLAFVARLLRIIFAFHIVERCILVTVAIWNSIFPFKHATDICFTQGLQSLSRTQFLVSCRTVRHGFLGHHAPLHSAGACLILWRATSRAARTCFWWPLRTSSLLHVILRIASWLVTTTSGLPVDLRIPSLLVTTLLSAGLRFSKLSIFPAGLNKIEIMLPWARPVWAYEIAANKAIMKTLMLYVNINCM